MYKLTVNLDQSLATVIDYSPIEPEIRVYRNAEARFLYEQQIIEIHSDGLFVGILPLGMTYVVFEHKATT